LSKSDFDKNAVIDAPKSGATSDYRLSTIFNLRFYFYILVKWIAYEEKEKHRTETDSKMEWYYQIAEGYIGRRIPPEAL